MKKIFISFFALMLLVSCSSLNTLEKAKISELESRGIRVPREEVKSPGAAAALNFLPGFGNFYLAAGTDEKAHWIFGFFNLITWPFSILWGVPEAALDADNINKRETAYYYTYGPGAKELMPPQELNPPASPQI